MNSGHATVVTLQGKGRTKSRHNPTATKESLTVHSGVFSFLAVPPAAMAAPVALLSPQPYLATLLSTGCIQRLPLRYWR